MKKLCCVAAAALALAGCSALSGANGGATATAVSTTITDAIAAVEDTIIVVQQVSASGSLTPAELASVTAAGTKLQADLTMLQNATGNSAAGTAATVLGDITEVIDELAPFVPAVASLIAALGEPAPAAAAAGAPVAAPVPVSVSIGNLPVALAKLQADLGVGKPAAH